MKENITKRFRYATFTFRNEEYTIKRCYYQDDDTGMTFSDTEADEMAMEELYAQYRERHGIPSPMQLKGLREKYGLSAHTMSKIAGTGVNQYGLYENGEMPSLVIGKRLASLFDKSSLLQMIDSAKGKLGKEYTRVREKVEAFMEPVSYAIEKIKYSDFEQRAPLVSTAVATPLKRARWTTLDK